MAEQKVAIDGAASTAAPINVTQGGNTANVAVPDANLGAGLVVTTGTLLASQVLSGASSTGASGTVNFGSAKQQVTLAITAGAGVTAGAVAVEVSHDGSNWYRPTPVTQSAQGVTQVTQAGAWRYGRANITTAITGGTVSATLMAA